MKHITAPDCPTGGIIYGYEGVREAYTTGRGKITMRARANVEELWNNREQIVITEIPYQVNKCTLIQRLADVVNQERIKEISEIRDESDREGIRQTIMLKRS